MGLFLVRPLLVFVAILLVSTSAKGQTSGPKLAVSQLIKAVQSRDYGGIFAKYDKCALEIRGIKRENPKVLWPTQIAKWRSLLLASIDAESVKNPGRIDSLFPDVGSSIASSYPDLGVFGTDAPSELNVFFGIFPKSATWKFLEVRSDHAGSLPLFDVFVAVAYPVVMDAPKVESRSLSKTIVEFRVTGSVSAVVSSPFRHADADAF